MGQRRRGREFALQMLFQIDLIGSSPDEVFTYFWDDQERFDEQRNFAEDLVRGVHEHRDDLDRRIVGSARNWKLERMSTVDRNVLRLAVYELVHQPYTPAAVIIDEAIEVAKKFGSEQSGSFVNGLLDNMRRELRPKERTRAAAAGEAAEEAAGNGED